MSDQGGTLCYIIQEHKDSPLYLCVLDRETQEFHRFPISVGSASRLASECSAAIHAAISGYSQKHAFQEVAKVLSERFAD